MERGEPADQLLIQRFRDGDESALQVLMARYEPKVRARLAATLPPDVGRKISVEDVLQEAYLTAVRRLDDFEARGDGAFGAWLMRIASLKLREEIRRYRETAKRGAVREVTRGARPDTLLFAGKGPTPSEMAIREEAKVRTIRALGLLSEDHRTILELVQREQLTLREAGERMGRSREAAKKLYGRALSRLAEILEADGRGAAHG